MRVCKEILDKMPIAMLYVKCSFGKNEDLNMEIEYVNDKVRKLEHEDKNGLIFPRFKESDDSSCAYLHITKK